MIIDVKAIAKSSYVLTGGSIQASLLLTKAMKSVAFYIGHNLYYENILQHCLEKIAYFQEILLKVSYHPGDHSSGTKVEAMMK